MKVLLIEDNKELAANVEIFLSRQDYNVTAAHSFEEARDKLVTLPFDCIVLDIMLPDGSGLDLLRFIKEQKLAPGILIVSAKDALDDKIGGLELGADDYLTKPFHLSELNARLRAIFRRKNLNGEKTVRFNEVSINTDTHEAFVHDEAIDLTRKEYDLLLYFLINKNRVLTRQSITEHLWGERADDLANFDFVYQHVKNLRKKISSAGGNDYITTVYGLGYRLSAST